MTYITNEKSTQSGPNAIGFLEEYTGEALKIQAQAKTTVQDPRTMNKSKDRQAYIKLRSFCTTKEMHNQVKWQPAKLGEILPNYA